MSTNQHASILVALTFATHQLSGLIFNLLASRSVFDVVGRNDNQRIRIKPTFNSSVTGE